MTKILKKCNIKLNNYLGYGSTERGDERIKNCSFTVKPTVIEDGKENCDAFTIIYSNINISNDGIYEIVMNNDNKPLKDTSYIVIMVADEKDGHSSIHTTKLNHKFSIATLFSAIEELLLDNGIVSPNSNVSIYDIILKQNKELVDEDRFQKLVLNVNFIKDKIIDMYYMYTSNDFFH